MAPAGDAAGAAFAADERLADSSRRLTIGSAPARARRVGL